MEPKTAASSADSKPKEDEEKEKKTGVSWLAWLKEHWAGFCGFVLEKLRALLPAIPTQARTTVAIRLAGGAAAKPAVWSSQGFKALPLGKGQALSGQFQRAWGWLVAATERRPGLMGTVYVSLAVIMGVLLTLLFRNHFHSSAVSADVAESHFRGSRLYENSGEPDRLPILYGLEQGALGKEMLSPQIGVMDAAPMKLSLVPRAREDSKGFFSANFAAIEDQFIRAYGPRRSSSNSRFGDPADDGSASGVAVGGVGAGLGPEIAAATTNKLADRTLILPPSGKLPAALAAVQKERGAPWMPGDGMAGGGMSKAIISDADFTNPADPMATLPPGMQGQDLVQAMLNMFQPKGMASIGSMLQGNLPVSGTIDHGGAAPPIDPVLTNFDGQTMRASEAVAQLTITTNHNMRASSCGGCGVELRVNNSRGTYFGEKIAGGY